MYIILLLYVYYNNNIIIMYIILYYNYVYNNNIIIIISGRANLYTIKCSGGSKLSLFYLFYISVPACNLISKLLLAIAVKMFTSSNSSMFFFFFFFAAVCLFVC